MECYKNCEEWAAGYFAGYSRESFDSKQSAEWKASYHAGRRDKYDENRQKPKLNL